MKSSRWFVAGILLFLLVAFAVECRLPKQFVWTPTFARHDGQPFGCLLFDSLLSASLPSGYAVSSRTLYQLANEGDTAVKRGILIVVKELSLTDFEAEALLTLAERGNKVMLVSNQFGKMLEDTLQFKCSDFYFTPAALKKNATSFGKKDSIFWLPDTVYSRQTFYAYPALCRSYFFRYDSLSVRKLAEIDLGYRRKWSEGDGDSAVYYRYRPAVAWTRKWGKGEFILSSTPLLFTNYGILDGNNAAYVFRLLSQMKDLPVVRTEAYQRETAQAQQSPFRYLLSRKPLRWALYLTVTAVLLCMIFTAKRRQRVISVMREPENKSLEFAKLIGTLYYQKKDHADLVRKKFTYFAETLRRDIQVDVEEVADDGRSFRRIARKTGMDEADVRKLILELRPVVYGGRALMAEDMRRLIDRMNELLKRI